MKNKKKSKMNNRNMIALMAALLMCIMGFSLTGCGDSSGDPESGYEDPGFKSLTLTEAMQENDRIWYCLIDPEIGKNETVNFALWNEGGNWYLFDPGSNLEMGDMAQMTDEEIIQYFKQDDGTDYPSGTSHMFSTSKPDFHVYTDETGNTVVSERIIFPYFHDYLDPPQDTEQNVNYGRESYSVQQTIYESQYIGFVGGMGMNMDPDHAFITRSDSDEWVEFTLDQLGTKGIEVD